MTHTTEVPVGAASRQNQSLKRSLNTPAVIYMVVAAAAPLMAVTGVMPISFLFSENPATPTYFVVATALLILFSVGFAAMSKHLPHAGAFYSYIQAGLGRLVGNGAAMLALGAYTLTSIALTVYAGPFVSKLFATFTVWQDSPWWLWSIITWALMSYLGFRSVDLSAVVLSVVLIIEVLALVVLGVFVLSRGGADGLSLEPLNPAHAFTSGYPASGIMWAALVFVGFEATAVYSREAKNPDKTVPRATYGAVFLLGILYVFTSLYMALGLGMGNAIAIISEDPTGALFALSNTFVSSEFTVLLNILLLGSIFAAAMSFANVVNRYQLVLSGSGMLPKFVGQVHHKHRAPSNASLALSAVSLVAIVISAVLNLDPVMEVFTPLVGILAFSVLALMFLSSVSAIFFFRGLTEGRPNLWIRFIAPFLASCGLLFVLVLSFVNIESVAGSPSATVLVTVLMIGLPILGAFLGIRARPISDIEAVEDLLDDELAHKRER